MESNILVVSAWIASSIVFSTSLILLLKLIARSMSCKWATTVTDLHFFVTWVLLESMRMGGKIKQATSVPFLWTLLLSILLVGSILLMNFNLVLNSIGFYQMSKLCCIPYIVLYTAIFKHTKYSWKEIGSLCLLIAGVGLFSISDVEFNAAGCIVAIVAVLCSAHSQMMMGELQHQFSVDGTSLQLLAAPIEVVLGSIAASIIELYGDNAFLHHEFSTKEWILIIGSCFLAVGVNVSGFGLIGQTSAVTYQVVGHVKTILLLVFGYLLFPSNWTSTGQIIRAVSGIVVALIGVVLYSIVKAKEMKKSASEKPIEERTESEDLIPEEKT